MRKFASGTPAIIAPLRRHNEQLQRRKFSRPFSRITSKTTAPQWHDPFLVSTMPLPGSSNSYQVAKVPHNIPYGKLYGSQQGWSTANDRTGPRRHSAKLNEPWRESGLRAGQITACVTWIYAALGCLLLPPGVLRRTKEKGGGSFDPPPVSIAFVWLSNPYWAPPNL